MSELAKIQKFQASRSASELLTFAIIVVLLVVLQAMFIAKLTVTLNAAAALAALGVTAP
jgi:hypothetical protein